MANKKITDLPEIVTPDDLDIFEVVDVSANTSNHIKSSNVWNYIKGKADQIYYNPSDGITVYGDVVLTVDVISIAADEFTWRIDGVEYTNEDIFSTTIAEATALYNRIDIIVANTDGSFTKVEGVESLDIAVKPDVPNNTLEVCFISITGAIISEPEPTDNAFVEKAEYAHFTIPDAGAINTYVLNVKYNKIRFLNADSIAGIDFYSISNVYVGKQYFIQNLRSSGTLTIKHLSGTGKYKFLFPNGQDLVLQPNEIAEFSLIVSPSNTGTFYYIGFPKTVSKSILLYHPSWNLTSANTWKTWTRNTSQVLTQDATATSGTGAVPDDGAGGTGWADRNFIMVNNASSLEKLTLSIRECPSIVTIEIYIKSFDLSSTVGRGVETNGQLLINESFTTSNSGFTYFKNDFTIAANILNADSIIFLSYRVTSGSTTVQGVQLNFDFN